jgi:hypothetical protein
MKLGMTSSSTLSSISTVLPLSPEITMIARPSRDAGRALGKRRRRSAPLLGVCPSKRPEPPPWIALVLTLARPLPALRSMQALREARFRVRRPRDQARGVGAWLRSSSTESRYCP